MVRNTRGLATQCVKTGFERFLSFRVANIIINSPEGFINIFGIHKFEILPRENMPFREYYQSVTYELCKVGLNMQDKAAPL